MLTIRHHIGGQDVDPLGGEWLEDVAPATGRVHARVASGDAADVERAVAAARAAFPAWAATPAAERSRILLRIADRIERELERFVTAESIDAGKPVALARRLDIPRAVANLRHFATAILHTDSPSYQTDQRALDYVIRVPRGVAGLISPWNLPLYLFTWKIAPAIATGNTVVAKPSELTPLTAALLATLSAEEGLPPGVLNVVHGLGVRAGAAIVGHPDVPAISFTGGTVTGREVARTAAPMFKRLSLELGGKNATIVAEDADLSTMLPGIVQASFENQGQICLCGSRVLVHERLYDRFVADFTGAVAALRQGDPLDDTTQQGALISDAHRAKVEGYIALARELGGEVVTGGGRPTDLPERVRDGYFVEPTVITGLPIDCPVNTEEIFGPVVTITPYRDDAEAIAMANATSYGLATSIWTRDLQRAHRMAAAVDVGTVWIDTWLLRDLRVPFGGSRASGVGREGGEEALHFFTESRTVVVAL
ncbi:MAG: aldehyde dehydrogenase [Chloroflexi bacterium]|nr:aldehyde dehydrogenase [Chloroflexota bacterium]